MNGLKKPLCLAIVNAFIISSFSTCVLAAPPVSNLPNNQNPGVLLNKERDEIREYRVKRDIQEQKDKEDQVVEDKREEEKAPDESKAIKFNLEKIEINDSEVITKEELTAITSKYEGKEITISVLYDIVNEINALYSDKGYLVCRAFLPEQAIENGIVKIVLIEGKTGSLFIEGNKTTRSGYIKDRLPLTEGKVANTQELNRALVWFNGTNSIQLQTEIQAGTEPGTTDYYITAYEPKRDVFTVFADNAGSKSSGEWRGGFGYSNRSLTGNRDELSITGMFSEGSTSGAISYYTPISKKGTKFGFSYSANDVKIKHGDLKDWDVEGDSYSFTVSVNQPLIVSSKKQVETFFEWTKQRSETDIMGFDWVDDSIYNYTLGLSATHFGSKSIIYHRHSVGMGRWTDIYSDKKDYWKYNLFGMYQKEFGNKNTLTCKVNAQFTPDDFLPSADQFYIGGVYSVRGYRENYLGADGGVSVNLEYGVPVSTIGQAFVFMDYGAVFGDNAFDDDTLSSIGLGFKWNFTRQSSATLTLGFPFKTDYNGENIDSMRAHFSVITQF